MPAEIFADGDQDYIEKFNTVAQQAFDGDAAAGRLDDHIAGTADKHSASAIVNTPAGGIAATDVQAAINELDSEKQPIDATLTAFAALTITADKLPYGNGSDTFGTTDLTSAGRALLDDADASAQRTTLGLGTAATLASDTDTTLAANSDSRLATQKAVKAYVDALIAASDAVVFKGVTDCSANPNYPAADAGHLYIVSSAGKIGGASGVVVEAGDMFICKVDSTASGDQATVGANWGVIQTNINGALTTADLGVTVAALAGAAFTGLSSVTANSATAALTLSNAGAGAALTADKQIVSTLATGTAPFSVASTTNVANLNASSLSGATFAAPGTIGGTTPGAATFTTLTATGQVSLGGAAGAEGLRVVTTASAVNYFQAQGSATGSPVLLTVQGADTNTGTYFATKGTAAMRFATGGGDQFRVLNTASAVDYLYATGSSAAFPGLYSAGSSTNANLVLASKGTGGIYATTNGGTTQLLIAHTASAVNWLQVQGSATGSPITLTSQGADTHIGLYIASKGTESIRLATGGGDQFSVSYTASAVNRSNMTGAGTGASPAWSAIGSDTHIDLSVVPKGANGRLKFGTHAAIGAETVSGYIEIKDAGGTVRKLAVVS